MLRPLPLPLPLPLPACLPPGRQSGTTLIEVLVTVVILAFGLLGIAAFQAKAQVGTLEAYQRAQAVVLLEDLRARMDANRVHMAEYVTATPLGTGDGASDCEGQSGSARDKCEWSVALKGAAETLNGNQTGAMLGARGCIDEVQAADTTAGVCNPGIYLVTVAWQGMHPTIAPALGCGRNAYGPETNRRAISTRISVGVAECKL